jgi:CBS domain-containing protein
MEGKRVKDLMLSLSEYAIIHEEASVKEALVALSKAQMGLTYDRHHHRAVLVLDASGKVVGKLSHWAILASLEPELFSEADDEVLQRSNLSLDFIQSLKGSYRGLAGNLEVMCKKAARVKVRDAMVQVRESIDRDAPLTEAICMMALGRWQSLLVTEKGEVVGILRLADVFEEVADLIRGEEGAD